MFRLVLSLIFLIISLGKVCADGGTVQISGEAGPYRITVFSASAIVRAGPEDMSVLVQDRKTNEPVLNRDVRFSFRRLDTRPAAAGEAWVPPCCRMKSSGGLNGVKATHQMATNKWLYAATVTLPEAGEWEVKTEVGVGADAKVIAGHMRVDPPAPPFSAYWPFFFLPVIGISGYILHSHLSKKSTRSPALRRRIGIEGGPGFAA